jgi:hypothetical protein
MSKQQIPVTKYFTSCNTCQPEELCVRDAASNGEHWKGEAARISFAGDGEKQMARPEDPDGPSGQKTI